MSAPLLTYKALAEEMGVRKGTLKRWRHEGMPAHTLEGGRIRFERAEVDAWIALRRADPNKLRRLRDVTFRRRAVVYFGTSPDGLIKIGWSSDYERRCDELGIEVLATVDGDKHLEGSFHRVFATDHVEDEWFRPSLRLRAFIDKLIANRTTRVA